MENKISEITRRNITDEIRTKNIVWYSRLSETEFLNRIFNLKNFLSDDARFENMERDLWQHQINNPYDWVYGDRCLNLLRGEDKVFLNFLCEMINPVVRNDKVGASWVQAINCRGTGWLRTLVSICTYFLMEEKAYVAKLRLG